MGAGTAGHAEHGTDTRISHIFVTRVHTIHQPLTLPTSHPLNRPSKDDTLEWPAEVQWNGTGHGPYPFWAGPVTADIDDGAAITSWWSAKQDAERLDHASCAMSVVGHEDDVPCTHLFVNQYAFYFSQDEEFCCISGSPNLAQALTAPQTTWMQGGLSRINRVLLTRHADRTNRNA